MSADNGIYILKSPKPPIKKGNLYVSEGDEFHYRVAHCQAIENIDDNILFAVLYFADSPIFDDPLSAMKRANEIKESMKGQVLEYGVSAVEIENYFPNMTRQEAEKALDIYIQG